MQCCTDEVCKLVVVSGSEWQSTTVDSDTAVSLIATLSEDPANWLELLANWPRYRTPVVLQELSDLQFTTKLADQGLQLAEPMLPDDGWLFINFDEKRVVTSPSLSISGHDRVFDLFSDESPDKRWPLSIHLPPWWELVDDAQPTAIAQGRSKPLVVPQTNREFLFGSPLIEYLARQILPTSSERVDGQFAEHEKNRPRSVWPLLAAKDKRAMHSLTVEIHREWLMTPREELQGLMPRQLLHGAHHWISRITEGQALRAQEGSPLIAAPTNVQGFEAAAMGSEEVVIYFDLCRHLIACGWEWLSRSFEQSAQASDRATSAEEASMQNLVHGLEMAREEFLSSPLEGGSTPNFIIQCSRRRVPRSPEIAIEGFDEQEKSGHILDCECPLCLMMAEGAFGPSFTWLDGYHLELDEEFAFSLFETHQQWKEESLFLSDEGDDDVSDDNKTDEMASDEFASAWDGIRSSESLPGDPLGHIKLAFMLAEIVSYLQTREVEPQVVRRLNDAFKQYRQTDLSARNSAKSTLIEQLELLAVRYPQLVPRIADFQSHLNPPVQRAST